MDEQDVQFLLTPSFKCSTPQIAQNKALNTENKKISDSSIFMIVMTLSAPKNFEARNFVRNSIKRWKQSTSRSEGIQTLVKLVMLVYFQSPV